MIGDNNLNEMVSRMLAGEFNGGDPREAVEKIKARWKAEYPRCRTCVHWPGDADGDSLTGHTWAGACGNDKVSDGSERGEAWVVAESLITGPDFGCVHHEERP